MKSLILNYNTHTHMRVCIILYNYTFNNYILHRLWLVMLKYNSMRIRIYYTI